MIYKEIKYGFSDIVMLPAVTSYVDSRSECNPFNSQGMLPLITSPMYSVVNKDNIHLFVNEKIYGIYPRGETITEQLDNTFIAYGLDEFVEKFKDKKLDKKTYVVIDMANGHMQKLLTVVRNAKNRFDDSLFLMVGNIAHPEAYATLAQAGADAVRLGIGTGGICVSASNTSIHYPLCSLIDECNTIRESRDFKTQIIADGGFKNFDEIIKALGLGADFVMCGGIFNKALESAGRTFYKGNEKEKFMGAFYAGNPIKISPQIVNQYDPEIKKAFKSGLELTKEYYGMSTKRAQREMGHEFVKTSEGISKINNVEYTLGQWTENFCHYLRSAMSYTGKRKLDDFIGNVDFQVITPQAFQAFYK